MAGIGLFIGLWCGCILLGGRGEYGLNGTLHVLQYGRSVSHDICSILHAARHVDCCWVQGCSSVQVLQGVVSSFPVSLEVMSRSGAVMSEAKVIFTRLLSSLMITLWCCFFFSSSHSHSFILSFTNLNKVYKTYRHTNTSMIHLSRVDKETKAAKLGWSMKLDGNLHQAMVINKIEGKMTCVYRKWVWLGVKIGSSWPDFRISLFMLIPFVFLCWLACR